MASLRPKGPLQRSKATSSTSTCYDEKTAEGSMSFRMMKTSKKAKSAETIAKEFDSSHVVSPFLDLKIIEQRVMAAKKASSSG